MNDNAKYIVQFYYFVPDYIVNINNLGRDRLEIQIRKLNNVTSCPIDHAVSKKQWNNNACIYGQHQRTCKQHIKP